MGRQPVFEDEHITVDFRVFAGLPEATCNQFGIQLPCLSPDRVETTLVGRDRRGYLAYAQLYDDASGFVFGFRFHEPTAQNQARGR